jgi:CheY-like chemotaxis protein
VIYNMHRRVLLAEDSDTVRGAAESALRQNGFEVISVVSGEKALEVLELSRPDLIVVGSSLEGRGQQPLYEQIQEDPKVSAIPLLLLAEPHETDLPLPREVIISKPVEPREFMEKVNTFVGRSVQPQAASSNPLSDAQLEDELLDAALGLDQIDVTDSEVMDKTQVSSGQKKRRSAEEMVGFDHDSADDKDTDSGKVESLMIRDEDSEIRQPEDKGRQKDKMSSSGKLEILNDQYGLIDGEAANLEHENRAHDYHWFINEMQKDTQGFAGSTSAETPDSQATPSDLTFSEPSSMVDPVTPSSGADAKQPPAGADKFIDEFKKEMQKIHSTEPESVTITDGEGSKGAAGEGLGWQDTLEKMTSEQLEVFTAQFVKELADRIAQLIAAKIDSDKLLGLLKREIINRIEKSR